MKKLILLTALGAAPVTWAAGSPLDSPDLQDLGAKDLCPAGKETSFGLTPKPVDTTRLDLSPYWDRNKGPTFVEPGKEFNIRLDLCEMDDGSYSVIGALLRYRNILPDGSERPFEQNLTAQNSVIKGKNLGDAIFGEPKDFDLLINRRGSGIRLQAEEVGGQTVVVGTRFTDTPTNFYTLNEPIFVGELLFGNPFEGGTAGDCGASMRPFTMDEVLGSATITFSGCAGQGAGHSSIYGVKEVRIVDQNEKLPDSVRGQPILIQGAEVESMVDYRNTHHNWCDSFRVQVPGMALEYLKAQRSIEGWPVQGEKAILGTAVRYGDQWTVIEAADPNSPCNRN